MRKMPYRPDNEITQSYNDGIVKIFRQSDIALPGYQPKIELSKIAELRFAEQRLGIQRYYAGRQNQLHIERVIRVPECVEITSQDVAVTQDGKRYRVDLVQSVQGVYPRSVDLTLVRYEQGTADDAEGGDADDLV